MPSPDHTRRTLRRRGLVAVLLLLGCWAVFHLADETIPSGGGVSDTNGSIESITGSNPLPAPAIIPSTPASTVTVALDASSPVSPTLRFNGRRFEFDPDASSALAECQRRMGDGSNLVALVGLTVKPGPRVKAELAARGVDLLDYVPDNGWIARVRGRREPATGSELFCFQPLDASLRIHPGIQELARHRSDVPVYVHLVRDRPGANLIELLKKHGFHELTRLSVGDREHLAGRIATHRLGDFLRQASEHPDTLWVEPGRGARLLNANAVRTTQSGAFDGNTPFFERGIFGTGQIIAICDTGLDLDSCFFRDADGRLPAVNGLDESSTEPTARKVIAANFLDVGDTPEDATAWDNHGHGTAVAGTAAGSNLYEPWDPQANNGMAPGARLIIQDAGFRGEDECAELPGLGCPVTNFYPAMLQAAAQGATIHNNSWGEQEESSPLNIYSQTCRELDLMTWSNKQFLVVCAAGNNAFSDTVGSPSTAKNGLSVAASLSGASAGRVASYSSRGWASDGRFKPDLTAPGHNLRTAASDGDVTTDNCYGTTQSGTSFAAPVVSGLAALVRDYFAQGFYPSGNPVEADRWPGVSAALVKAVLINAAMPMSEAVAPPPSRDQGWGRVNLSRTLRISPDHPALLAMDLSPGFLESPAVPFQLHLRLTTTNRPLKITLVWSDHPATPGADQHLVNDLDLRVRTSLQAFKGNRLVDGQSVPGGDYDRLNNVEQVEWTPDRAETVEISVWAHRIVVGPQDFSLVATGDFEVIPWRQDEDQDGLPDFWEHWHFGNLARQPGDDADGDEASNAAEFTANTNPTDAESNARLEIVRMDNGGVSLRMMASEGRRYVLESQTGGSPASPWSPLSEPILIGEPIGVTTLLFTHLVPVGQVDLGSRFYRVRIDASR